ncbi:MAG: hypothetical protein RL215_226 [Planctomycetota bacterium]|jgi:hypothetical protein
MGAEWCCELGSVSDKAEECGQAAEQSNIWGRPEQQTGDERFEFCVPGYGAGELLAVVFGSKQATAGEEQKPEYKGEDGSCDFKSAERGEGDRLRGDRLGPCTGIR